MMWFNLLKTETDEEKFQRIHSLPREEQRKLPDAEQDWYLDEWEKRNAEEKRKRKLRQIERFQKKRMVERMEKKPPKKKGQRRKR